MTECIAGLNTLGLKTLANKTCGKGIDLRTEKGYVVWWPKKASKKVWVKLKGTSTLLNEWLEGLFCYKS